MAAVVIEWGPLLLYYRPTGVAVLKRYTNGILSQHFIQDQCLNPNKCGISLIEHQKHSLTDR